MFGRTFSYLSGIVITAGIFFYIDGSTFEAYEDKVRSPWYTYFPFAFALLTIPLLQVMDINELKGGDFVLPENRPRAVVGAVYVFFVYLFMFLCMLGQLVVFTAYDLQAANRSIYGGVAHLLGIAIIGLGNTIMFFGRYRLKPNYDPL